MNTEELLTELKACLALQKEIADKVLELAARYKAVLESERAKGNNRTIVARIDGEIYRLMKLDVATDEMSEQMRICHELGGFYGGYRLVNAGKVYE
jgi:hypothetical protein